MVRARIPPETETRDRILTIVAGEPGVSIREIADRLGVHPSTATYHLAVLERRALVATTRTGRWRAVFPAGSVPCPVARAVAARAHRPALMLALRLLLERTTVTAALLQRAGLSAGGARWAKRVLVSTGAARPVPGGVIVCDADHAQCLSRVASKASSTGPR